MSVIEGGEGAVLPQEMFSHLLQVVTSERFLKMQGLGSEVPFFICPYPATAAVEIAHMERQLVNRLEQKGVRVLAINLYDLCIELLRKRGIWDRVLQIEEGVSKDEW